MAFPALIQKIFDLRRALREANEENAVLCAAFASLAEANVRMSARIAELEMEKAQAGISLGEIAMRLARLEKADAEWASAIAEHSGESVRISSRLAELEVDGARSGASRADIAERVAGLESDSDNFACAHADLAGECVRLADRLVQQELGAKHPNLPPVQAAYVDPEGYDLFCGAKVAPVLMVEEGHSAHPGAAFTVVVGNL